MEFVGRTVKKDFKGFGVFSGTVRSYDVSSGLFEIVYDNGDSEELGISQLTLHLPAQEEGEEEEEEEEEEEAQAQAQAQAQGLLAEESSLLGRKPKKRPRIEPESEVGGGAGNASVNFVTDLNSNCDLSNGFGGNFSGNSNSNGNLGDGFEGNLEMGDGFVGKEERERECVEVDRNLHVNIEEAQTLGKGSGGGIGIGIGIGENLNRNDVFDLNAGFNLNEEVDLNGDGFDDTHVKPEDNVRKRDCIDLNLDVNGDLDDDLGGGNLGVSCSGTQKRECDFDLNLEVCEEIKDADGDGGVMFKASDSSEIVEEIQKKDVEEKCEEDGGANGLLKQADLDINEGLLMQGISGSLEPAVADASLGLVGLEKENSVEGCSSVEVQLKDGVSEAGATVVHGDQGNLGSPCKQGSSRRKRRRKSDNLKSMTETVLRRSARRGSAQNRVLMTSCAADDSPSPAVSAVTEEVLVISGCEASEKISALPFKPQLPPSSQNLNLDEIPIPDLFSVYACLRSFSSLLFLSPFELEDFVAVLKSKSPSTLFDCIHVSILQTLRKHLENLSNEGSESASNCLRSLNWDLLDLITWPIFMAEYLLIHGSGLKPGFNISHLKLFKSDYYKQPAAVKVEILRCLCDDMIEVEVIRSELNRRSLAADPDMVFDRSTNLGINKKRKLTVDDSGGSCLTKEVGEDATDWNSDECCLCKMDGSLICCDGCPAAYHSKCVGIASDLLPEGDWYCPECAIDRHKPWMKPRKSLRGAELLGIDPHGRLYFSSCGYLLVSESCDTESSFSYYHRNDLDVVIEVLKESDISYGAILMAIYKQWVIPLSLNGASNLDLLNHSVYSDILMKGHSPAILMTSAPLTSSKTNTVKNETDDARKVKENCNSGCSVNLLNSMTATESPHMNPEGSAGATQLSVDIQNFQNHGPHDSNRSEKPRRRRLSRGCPLTSTSVDVKRENNMEAADPGHSSSTITTRKRERSPMNCGIGYMNYYSFAQTASSVAEELMPKSSDKINENTIITEEDIIAAQMKAIVKKSTKFGWANTQNLDVDARKEKCGWCFSCRVPTDDRDCLFNMYLGTFWEGSKSDVVGHQSKKNRKSHLMDVICHILSVEDRLHGLLLGPWLNPHFTKYWQKSILKASDVGSVKHLLLTLESNLRPLALSTEWSRHVDSVATVGSAAHVVISSSRASSKHGINRKRVRSSEPESNPSSNAASGLGILWWRGGRLSRKVFNWKVLPRSLASKAARQAGCVKIPGILYPENSEYAKRSRYVAWRSAVETATSVEQLAFQVREFDSNIKWDNIENTLPLPALDKETIKSIRLFKKVIIRRKSTEGEVVKYLLDFGKRRVIPGIVKRHGSPLEDSSSERKRYWLAESYVPMYLLKNFEEKRIARKSNEMKSRKLPEVGRVTNRRLQKRGFSYLFSKAERSEYHQCGHCNKDVLIREAVSCQHCKGFFHKRHVRKSAGAITAECTYTCHRCQNGMSTKVVAKRGKTGTKGGKLQTQKRKKASKVSRPVRLKSRKKVTKVVQVRSKNSKKVPASVPLRRSPRKAKGLSLQNKKLEQRKKGKKIKSKKTTFQKPKRTASWRKKRTHIYHSYWLNGLRLSRKPNDERVTHFREKNIHSSSENLSVTLGQPKCLICCEARCSSTLNYIACEICKEWFHEDALGLTPENIDRLIGFRCHICCKRTPPVCPHVLDVKSDVSQLVEAQSNDVVECNDEVSNTVPPLSEIACN